MSNSITISPEITRLAQCRAGAVGRGLTGEIARLVVQEAIVELDPEFGFMVESEKAYSAKDPLVRLLDVNDIMVNEHHIDVRALDDNGEVSINSLWVGSSYLTNGSFVVHLESSSAGRVVGWVPSQQWRNAEPNADNSGKITTKCQQPQFNLLQTLANIVEDASNLPPGGGRSTRPDKTELAVFASNPLQLVAARRCEIVDAILLDETVQLEYAQIAEASSAPAIGSILKAASVWNQRVNEIASSVSQQFPHLSHSEIQEISRRIGEAYGGQPESPAYKSALLVALLREELLRRAPALNVARLGQIFNAVLSGQAGKDVVAQLIGNKAVLDLASNIKQQRKNAQAFMAATAEELSAAFGQLALQPAYATHSQDPQAGMEAINETLDLLYAAEMIEEAARGEKFE